MVPLVRTKLHPPEMQPSLITRPRLCERLRAALHSRLALIAAPAGYGKTSLLTEWMETARREWSHIAWLSLDANDNDIRRLLMYLLAALSNLPGERRDRLRAMIESEEIDAEQWFAELLNDLAEVGSSTVIVLDDYQTISDTQIHRAITFLVDHLPPRCRLVIATRSDPPLPLARWRARGYLAELRSFDLAFTAEEAAAFLLETMELPLSREQIVSLIDSTEGWPAGLHLVALALRGRADRGALVEELHTTNRYVVDYLIEDVFNHLPAHIQQFLLQTSILERLCGPLCDALLGVNESSAERGTTGQSYSQLILAELERNNLFLIPLDAERVWYRYHHLFAEVLRERLITGSNADHVAMLHRRAGSWYAAHGLLVEAVSHALRARAIDDVVAMIEPIGLTLIAQVGEVTLRRWLPEIPDTAFEGHPRLALLRAWLATSEYQPAEAGHWIGVAEQALANVASGAAAPIGTIANLRGELSAVRLRLAILQGDTEKAVTEGRQALAWLQTDQQALRMRVAKDLGYACIAERDTARAEKAFAEALINGFNAGLPYISALATSDYAYTLLLRGAVSAALTACRETIDQMGQRERNRRLPGIGLPLLALADLHGLRHEFAGALPALAEAESVIKPGSTTSYFCLLIATARIARARADDAGALRVIRQGRFLARQRGVQWVVTVLNGLEAQMLIAKGEIDAARALLSDLPTAAEFRYLPIAAFYAREHITRARYEWRLATAQAAGDVDALRALATELDNLPVSDLWQTLSPIDAILLQALALAAAGEDATAALTRALNLAASERIVAPFVAAGEPLRQLLTTLSAQRHLSPFGEHLLSLLADETPLPVSPPPALPIDNLPEPLSQREIEVLRLMAEGRTNQEIADDLVIAVSTVKSHINNIFSKLGVATRTQAVARGRRLGLI